MQRNGFTYAERAQCVLWLSQGYPGTNVLGLFHDSYGTSPSAHYTIQQWCDEYQTRGLHNHRGGNGRGRIGSALQNEMRELFS